MAAPEVFHDSIALADRSLGVDGRDIDICGFQGSNLIFHQSKERGDNDGDAMVDYGGQLETQRFAEGGGGLYEDIVAVEGGGDDFSLVRSGDLLVLIMKSWSRNSFRIPEAFLVEDATEGEVDIDIRCFLFRGHRGVQRAGVGSLVVDA